MLYTLLAFLLALGVLITFHEFGHYWVARRCGIRVQRFSVGFGKVLLRRTDRGGTEWALSAIPLGGYVKMLDEAAPGAGEQERRQAFNHQPVGKRMLVILAGPVANLLLAAILYTILGLVGRVEPQPIVAAPPAHSAAAAAGFQQGDRIVSIDNAVVRSWSEARWHLIDALTSGGDVPIIVDPGKGSMREYTLHLEAPGHVSENTDLMAAAGLRLAPGRPVIDRVSAGRAAATAGLRAGDIVVGVNGLAHPTMSELVGNIQTHAGAPVMLNILRDDKPSSVVVWPVAETAKDGARVGRIGALLTADVPVTNVRYDFPESVVNGVGHTFEATWLSLKMIGRMATGGASLRNISGPVTIADYAGQTARIGLSAYLGFLALISVSIGVLNLLPIPLLDGGQFVYCVLEAARGHPVSDYWRLKGQQFGLGLLMALMVLAFFNDFSRLFS
ncbi:MAG: RIP metalloprotease RseP [Candidimonas sp.]|nr:MAG: RIP metalloprotease RseP [Candidimonas sp.]